MEIVLLTIIRNDSIWDTMSCAVDFKFEDDRFSFQICAYRVSLSVGALLGNAIGWPHDHRSTGRELRSHGSSYSLGLFPVYLYNPVGRSF